MRQHKRWTMPCQVRPLAFMDAQTCVGGCNGLQQK